jgi:Ca-activated chloride channel family protein
MRFAAPGYLWLLLGVPVLVALYVLTFRLRRRALAALGDLPLLRRLVRGADTERRVIKAVLVVAAFVFLVLALARPQWGAREETVSRRGVDVILAVDTSLSMLAEDVRPSRLVQARAAVSSFIDLLRGDRVGLVAFAGAAYVACPLTLDYAAAGLFVDLLDTGLLPVQGTGIAQAIRTATRAFTATERRHRVLVLITDGEDHEGDVEAAARAAAAEGIVIYTVGVGSPAGEPIPLRNARGDVIGYKEDRDRRKVTSRLGEAPLEAIALATGGKYFRSTPEGIELQKVYEEIAAMDQRTMQGRMTTVHEERYQVPLLVALLLLGLEAAIPERRGTRDASESGAGRAAA